ncbi:hypothetical protein [Maritimibacter sp. 55A14]|uniref:hypothetical protein n=1 Tax=Maritimibacter sp. 55A14 TaxID=2174844 RepID=UPI0011B298DA|nr:hypothetical protein [Maritimibacter sp. 55A14]
MRAETETAPTTAAICDLQTSVLRLAVEAEAGSELRRSLCEAASFFPGPDTTLLGQAQLRGGISRDDVAGLLRRINAARENGDDPQRILRAMRNAIERTLDIYDLVSE